MPNILLVEDDDALSEGIALALRANVPSECLKLISAVIVALAIAAPALRARAAFRRRRAQAEKGGAAHA